MFLSKKSSMNLSQLVDARDWPLIARLDASRFQDHLPEFLEQYLLYSRDNLDDLLTLGVACGGNQLFELDRHTIAWLEQHCSPRAVEIATNLLAGCWHPQLYILPMDFGLLERLLSCCAQVTLAGDQLVSYQNLLDQLSDMPASSSLPDSLRKQLDKARGTE